MITKTNPINALEHFLTVLTKFKIIKPYTLEYRDKVNFVKKHSKTKLVLLMGSNPGNASMSRKAFDPSTKSRQVVDSWFYNDPINNYYIFYDNLYQDKTPNNRPLNQQEISMVIPHLNIRYQGYEEYGVKLIGCGNQVRDVLNKVKIEHFHMPHPSGTNRFWNDKAAGEAKIKEMREWIHKRLTI